MRAKGCIVLLCMLLVVAPCVRAETGTVTASALALRVGPGTEHAAVCEIPNGEKLTIIAYNDGWYSVDYNGLTGYVYGRYVRVDMPDALPTTPPYYGDAEPERTTHPNLKLPELAFGSDGENNPAYPRVLMPGDAGSAVVDLQMTLQNMGYAVTVDGQYGYDTQAAVIRLQRSLGLDADGFITAQTRAAIGGATPGQVELLDWWLGGSVAFARLAEAVVIDVRTGRSFHVWRYGGDAHCDVEPLTDEDTQVLRSLCGGTWTVEYRPVWVAVSGRVIAASLWCMPHDGQHQYGDGAAYSRFCMHFYQSRDDDTNQINELHAMRVQEAWEERGGYVGVTR